MAKRFPPVLIAHLAATSTTVAKLAQQLGIRHQTVYCWLAGQHVPTGGQAHRLAKHLLRPDLVDVIAADRAAHVKAIRRSRRRAASGAA